MDFPDIEFDQRGIGLSDRLDGEIPDLETRISDVTTVMDAVGWESAHFLGFSEGGLLGLGVEHRSGHDDGE